MMNIATPITLRKAPGISLPALSGLRRLLGHQRSVIGLSIVLPIVLVAILAPVLPLADPLATNPLQSLQAPSAEHILGTDKIGRDLLSRIVSGARTSLFVGFSVATIAVTFGILLGTLAGFMGKFSDGIIMSVVDVFL